MTWFAVAPLAALAPGECLAAAAGGEALLLCRTAAGDVYAVEDCCSHDGAPLSGGRLEGGVLECGRHGARFDLATGRPLRGPACSPILAFPVRVTPAGEVEVEVE